MSVVASSFASGLAYILGRRDQVPFRWLIPFGASVTTETQQVPRNFMYLDAEGIESLYAQIVDRIEVEFIQTRKKAKSGEVGLKAAFGSMLIGLLGLREVGGETKLGVGREQIEEAKLRLSVERKLSNLLGYLAKHKGDDYFESIQEAGEITSSQRRSVYFRGEARFDAPDFYPGRSGVARVNEAEAILFVIEPVYDASESYFKKAPLRFAMSAGLQKFARLHGRMGATSHEAIFFRGAMGKNINLGVFGQVSHISGNSLQVKPFVIWRP